MKRSNDVVSTESLGIVKRRLDALMDEDYRRKLVSTNMFHRVTATCKSGGFLKNKYHDAPPLTAQKANRQVFQPRGPEFESQARQGKWASLLMCI